MLKIKVGMMPGRLVEVVTNEGTTAREIFEIANVELSNHEIRLDGEKPYNTKYILGVSRRAHDRRKLKC